MLDILIRDGSDNRRSLDDVMRELYRSTYKKGRGFTAADWWPAVSRAAGGRSFTEFNARYIDGREPFPWSDVLAARGPPAGGGHRARAQGRARHRAGLGRGDRGAGRSAGRRGAGGGREGRRSAHRPRRRRDHGSRLRHRVPRALREERGRQLADPGACAAPTRSPCTASCGSMARVETRLAADPNPSEKAKRVRSGILHGRSHVAEVTGKRR